ncbi:lysine-specific demethylase 2A, partial [Poecilia reticulata]|uniref:lysine-specific demethylase 2A n=1 Tax=Poecilia reticulata TaxID=8081 RepID=UPI0007E9F208
MEDPHTRYSKRLRTAPRRQYQDDGISDDEIEGKRTFDLDEKLQCERFGSDLVKHMEGKDFTYEYIQREGLRDPIIFKTTDGLGIQMPDPDFSVSDVKLFVGSRRIVDVMDVNTQKGIEMSMAQWRRYYETPPSEREKLYNVISLEFSHTRLENLVKRPASVDLIDWVDNMWPRHLKERQRDSTNAIIDMHYPKVQKYCLMSVQGCFTDFHIDFGGTSVWYHILRGAKVFWLIPPTPQNLDMYENWSWDMCLDKRLWARIDLSIKRTVTPQALTGIIKRQPVTLDLSWTNISKKQLNWLIGRLPALCSTGCPLLRSLDLRNAYGVKDAQIRELVIPPGCDNRSQLRSMQCLRLAGLDISDPTLRLVIRHMPHLTKLDLSHCNSLTDHSINLLTAVGSSTRNTLTELNLGGCSKLTDACLKYLRRLSCISLLDLRGCKGVARKACEAFISELSVNTLYCLSDEKLIQRISYTYPFYYEMCWYVIERYLFCLTNISHLTPEFQKYSLGIGLTRADVGNNDPPINGTNEVDGEVEEKPEVEEIKEEEGDEELENKVGTTRPVLTPFELEGLWNLLGKLEELPAHKKCVPAGIRNAAALLEDMRAVLRERAGDDIKLSCTGEPIVKWPERPSWYQPPTPPAPVIYRPRLGPSLHKSKRSTKHTSISALRRRRVRCKRCSACCRKECGDCQYCLDMRKFGGPGRMKKSCVMRQCLMPALPNTARCAVCGEGEFDESDPSTYSLMECTACSQIVHRQCVKEPGEGKINKDLPSCWECPKCYQGNDSDSESSSEEESEDSEGSTFMPQSKRPYQDDVCEEGPSQGKQSRLHGRQTAPPPSQKLLLQHQQSRKRESALEHRLKKRIKMERSKLLRKQASLDRSPRFLSSRMISRLHSPVNRLSQGQIRGSAWATGSSHSSILGGNGSFGQQKSSHGLVLHS